MDKEEQKRLVYRRQYLITPVTIECPFVHSEIQLLNGSFLYTHVDLVVNSFQEADKRITILGDMFDFRTPAKSNKDIAKDLIGKEFEEFLQETSQYTGRFVILFEERTRLYLVTDATSTRKVFHTTISGNLWMASTSHLLARVAQCEPTDNESILRYHKSDDFVRLDYANIGDTTYYKGMKQLMSNHFLNADDGSVNRFWPNHRIEHRQVDEVAPECAEIIEGYMKAIVNRYQVMLPVTAGNDTRLLLAASRELTDKIYYYINKEFTLTEKYTDIRIARKLFKRIGLDYHVLEMPSKIDDTFWEIYFGNNPFATPKYIPHIFNYYTHYQDMVNLPGNFASAPWGLNRLAEKNINPEALARSYRFKGYEHAVEYYSSWLVGCHQLSRDCNIEIMRMFYWEERIGNWATQTQLDKDMAQEDINPFNSRILLTKFLSVKKSDNNVPDYLLHRAIIRELWPELLKIPINPSSLNRILNIAKTIGVLDWVFKAKFKTAR